MSDSYLVQLFSSVVILSGLLLVLLVASRSLQKRRFTGDMKVKDRLALDNGVSLLIVEVKGQDYLMSVGGKQAVVLKELDS